VRAIRRSSPSLLEHTQMRGRKPLQIGRLRKRPQARCGLRDPSRQREPPQVIDVERECAPVQPHLADRLAAVTHPARRPSKTPRRLLKREEPLGLGCWRRRLKLSDELAHQGSPRPLWEDRIPAVALRTKKYASVGAVSSSISMPSMARQPSSEPSLSLPHSTRRTVARTLARAGLLARLAGEQRRVTRSAMSARLPRRLSPDPDELLGLQVRSRLLEARDVVVEHDEALLVGVHGR
jgi:hypothetical protein